MKGTKNYRTNSKDEGVVDAIEWKINKSKYFRDLPLCSYWMDLVGFLTQVRDIMSFVDCTDCGTINMIGK